MDILQQAYEEYTARQDRVKHPDGKFDNGGRWYPSDEEKQTCCHKVRSPSRRWPYSLMSHCRTLRHVAKLHGVTEGELRELAREMRGPTQINREGGEEYYKLVAVLPDGRMVSIFDGETEYQIGEMVQERPQQKHSGGIYVFSTLKAARWTWQTGNLPAKSAYHPQSEGNPGKYAILRVRAEGSYCRYKAEGDPGGEYDKLAFHKVTPLEVVEIL